MAEEPDPARLEALEERIQAVKRAQHRESKPEEKFTQASQGWRMVIELVSGLGIGFVIGYGLDTLFGTMPILLVVLTLLGFAAGVKTMLRTAQEFQNARQAGGSAGDEKAAPAADDEGE